METKLIAQIQSLISKPLADERELIHLLKKIIFEADTENTPVRDSRSISDLYSESIGLLEKENVFYKVIRSGFIALDRLIGGFAQGELVVIGGRPAAGKTQLLVNLACNISGTSPVLYFTYDLSDFMLTSRIMSCLSGLGTDKILQHHLSKEEKEKLVSLEKQMNTMKIYINDSYNNSISAFRSYCHEQINSNGVKVIIVDYLQMMSSNRYRHNRELEISHISRELKNIAKDYNVCVIASSQLSRAVELRSGSKRPQLSDLRESGAIEQDADKVIFVHRPEMYGLDVDDEGNSTAGVVGLIVSKNRNGRLGDAHLMRDPDFTSFSDFETFKTEFAFSPDRLKEFERPF
jgi:replicative DNA helicase